MKLTFGGIYVTEFTSIKLTSCPVIPMQQVLISVALEGNLYILYHFQQAEHPVRISQVNMICWATLFQSETVPLAVINFTLMTFC